MSRIVLLSKQLKKKETNIKWILIHFRPNKNFKKSLGKIFQEVLMIL